MNYPSDHGHSISIYKIIKSTPNSYIYTKKKEKYETGSYNITWKKESVKIIGKRAFEEP
jgi:hypothetical protein